MRVGFVLDNNKQNGRFFFIGWFNPTNASFVSMNSDTLTTFVKEFYGINEPFSGVKKCVRINEKYLPDYETVIGGKTGARRLLFVKSRMGTGKTVQNLTVTKKYPSHLIISPRITLSQSLKAHPKGDPDTVLYSNISGPLSHTEHPKLICQFQSLCRVRDIMATEMYAKWRVLILDEIDALMKEMICSNTMTSRRRGECQTVFKKLINSGAELIVVSDAYLTKWHYDFIVNTLLVQNPDDEITVLINDHPGVLVRFKEITLYPNFSLGTAFLSAMEQELIADEQNKEKREESRYVFRLNKRLSEGVSTQEKMYMNVLRESFETKDFPEDASYAMFRDVMRKHRKIVVVCSTKTAANIVADFFVTYCGLKNEKDVLLITGDRVDRVKYLARVKYCRVLVYSSSVKCGVDFNDCFFDVVYVLLSKRHPLALVDIVQMIGRVRQFGKLSIAVEYETKQWKSDAPLEYRSPLEIVDEITDITKTVVMIRDEERRLNKSQPNFIKGLLKVMMVTGEVPIVVRQRKHYSIKTAVAHLKLNPATVRGDAKFVLQDYGAFDRRGEYLEACKSTILDSLRDKTFVRNPECVYKFLNLNVAATWHTKLRELYYFSGCVNSLAGIVTLMAGANDDEMEIICSEEFEEGMCVEEDGIMSGDWSFSNELSTPYLRIRGVYRYLKHCAIRLNQNSGSSVTTDETRRIAALTHKITERNFEDEAAMRDLHRFFIDDVMSDNIDDVVQNIKDNLIYDVTPSHRVNINRFLLHFSVN